jgi:deoxyribonuclease-4
MGEGYDEGIARVAAALDDVHKRCDGFQAGVLLETTAGQGTSIGSDIDHLRQIIATVAAPERLGVCLDTCHLFAAGYNIAQRDGYEETIETLDNRLGLERIRCIHMNDSKTRCGSRVDRHEHLGKGKIGRDAFRWIVTDTRLTAIPKILETPKGEDGPSPQRHLRVASMPILLPPP